MHFPHPVFKTLEDELRNHRVIAVDRVAATGVVTVVAAVHWIEMVETLVANTLEVNHRTAGPALGSMVEHHIKDDTDTGLMQGLDHVAELPGVGSCVRRGAVTGMRAKITVGTVAPVVVKIAFGYTRGYVLFVEGHHRHHFDVGNTQLHEVGYFFNHPVEGAGCCHSSTWVPGESTDMQFVDDRLFRADAPQWFVTFPVIVRGRDHGTHRGCDIITGQAGLPAIPQGCGNPACPRIEQHLVTVKTKPRLRHVIRPVDAPGVIRSRRQIHDQHMPEEKAAMDTRLQGNDLGRQRAVRCIEQQ